MRQAVVLAGGLATRLGALARDLPKYLLPVGGEPFAHHQLQRLARAGYDEVVICIGHLGAAIRDALGTTHLGMALAYADEGGARLGTGGALKRAEPLLEPAFLVTYGDSLLPFDYAAPLDDLLRSPEALATMAVFENAGAIEPSNVRVDEGLVVEYRKGVSDPRLDHIDYGALAIRREALGRLPQGASDLGELLSRLAEARQLRALAVERRFFEIGSPEGLADLEAALASEIFP